jgi:phenylalanyl-tRNA synthetase beta chain
VFELGRVFMRDADAQDGPLQVAGVRQPMRLSGAAWGPAVEEQWGVATRQVDFFDVKMDVEALFGARGRRLRFEAAAHPALHPGRSARIELDGKQVGWLGELHPRWAQQADLAHAPVVFELDVDALSEGELPQVRELSRQPVVVRDLALWVDASVSTQSMLDTVFAAVKADAQLAVVQDARVFDVWREKAHGGEPVTEKSLAFRFWLQDTEVTLDEARVADCLSRIKDALVSAHGARQRT